MLLPERFEIYLKPGITDMRKAINGLSILVKTYFKKDIFTGDLFLFCNRNKKNLKILYWHRNGFSLWQKKLEKHKFPWPMDETEVRELTHAELEMLLKGIDFFHAHQELRYKKI